MVTSAVAVIELAGVEKTYRSGRISFRALNAVDLALTLIVIRGRLRRATRIQPGTALRYQ